METFMERNINTRHIYYKPLPKTRYHQSRSPSGVDLSKMLEVKKLRGEKKRCQ